VEGNKPALYRNEADAGADIALRQGKALMEAKTTKTGPVILLESDEHKLTSVSAGNGGHKLAKQFCRDHVGRN
jgi:hypothetical protein